MSPAGHRRAVILLCSALMRPHRKYSLYFWSAQFKKYKDLLKRVKRRAMKMVRGQEQVSCEDRLRAGAVQSGEDSRLTF